jgi:hypothetical protein
VLPIVTLGPEHRGHFTRFSCGGGDPEKMVRELLADALAYTERRVWGLGIFDGHELVSLIAWREKPGDPETWEVPILATAIGHTRKGHAERLKREVLARAGLADPPVFAVTSAVRVENNAMLELNSRLGALIALDPTDPDWRTCLIPVG